MIPTNGRGRAFLVCASLLLAAAGGGFSQTFSQGMDAYRAGDHASALAIWQPLAEAGDADAQFGMGVLFHQGDGVPQDYVEAATWFRRAAEQGHAAAQFNLGNAYQRGRGVPHDEAQAVLWWSRAAVQDLPQAQFNLAMQYYHGLGTQRDFAVALSWFRRAADGGHRRARQIVAAVEELAADADWVRRQDPADFTLQLLPVDGEIGPIELMSRAPGGGKLAVLPSTESNGHGGFTALYGTFDTVEQAKRAAFQLPPGLHDLRPWIRTFGDVQAQLAPAAGEPAIAPPAAAASERMMEHEPWLLAQPPSSWTLQLMAAHSLQSIRSFTDRHRVPAALACCTFERDGETWFVLLCGSYGDLDSARRAAAELVRNLDIEPPWVRSFADVQAMIDGPTPASCPGR